MTSVYLTPMGYQRLSNEMRELIEVRRPQVMADLIQAREYGDLRENAEYEVAKRDQGVIEGRIHELEQLLAAVEIIEVPAEVDEAVLGARVRVTNMDANSEHEYVLVSEQEAHLVEEHLSVESPLGRALYRSKVGDVISYDAPAGLRRVQVLAMAGANINSE